MDIEEEMRELGEKIIPDERLKEKTLLLMEAEEAGREGSGNTFGNEDRQRDQGAEKGMGRCRHHRQRPGGCLRG